MKSWSTESNPKGDLFHDETPIPRVDDEDRERAIRFMERAGASDLLEMLGLSDAAQ